MTLPIPASPHNNALERRISVPFRVIAGLLAAGMLFAALFLAYLWIAVPGTSGAWLAGAFGMLWVVWVLGYAAIVGHSPMREDHYVEE